MTTRAELMDTDKLTGWLRKQDPDKEYVWSDPVFCLMGQYLSDHDALWGSVQYSDMPNYHEIAKEKPWTYGAALERAEQLQLAPPALQIAAPVTIDAREPVTVDAE